MRSGPNRLLLPNQTLLPLHLAPLLLAPLLLAPLLLARPASASPAAAAHNQAAARAELLHFGCTSVVDIQRNPDGSWTGQCTKGGSIIPIGIKRGGAVWSPVQLSD